MKIEEFIKKLIDVLDLSDDALTDENSMLKGQVASLDVLTIIALCDDLFAKRFTTGQLWSITTVRSLMDLIGMENFEK